MDAYSFFVFNSSYNLKGGFKMKKIIGFILTLVMAFTLAACDQAGADVFVDITLESNVTEAELTQDPAEVTEGMEVTVTASELNTYDFTAWVDSESDTEVSTERVYTFTVDGPVTLEAVYDDDSYSLSMSSDIDATLTASQEGPFEPGDEVTVTANQLDTYTFLYWMDADSEAVLSENTSYTFSVDEDMTIEAVYEDTLTANERIAHTMVEQTTMNAAYLDTFMSDFTDSESMSMSMNMGMEMADPNNAGETIVYDMQIGMTTTTNSEGNLLTKLNVVMDMPYMGDGPLTMTAFMEENDDSTKFIVNVEMLLDMLVQQEGIDIRTLMDLDSDYVHYTIPHNLEGTDQEVIYDDIIAAIYSEILGAGYEESDLPDFDQTTIDALFGNFGDIMAFMSFQQFSSYEDVDLVMSREGTMASGTLSMGGDALEAFAEDFFEEVYTTLKILDETDELPPYSEVITTQEYNLIMGLIGMSPDMNVEMDYDAETESMTVDMNVYTFLNFLFGDSPDFENVNDISMTMTMEKDATIDEDFSNSTNLESLGEEFIQIMSVVNTSAFLGNVAGDSEVPDGTHTLNELEVLSHYMDIPFVDKDMSEVTIDTSGSTPVYSIELYYQHNSQPVFVDPEATFTDLSAVLENEPSTRADIEAILELVDDSNFDLYPVLGDLLTVMMEEAVTKEPSMPIPKSD
jgi:hypothetical protein